MPETEISVERTAKSTVRLDLRQAEGQTTIGTLRAFLDKCVALGADDSTPVTVLSLIGLLGSSWQPIIGATIDHPHVFPGGSDDPT